MKWNICPSVEPIFVWLLVASLAPCQLQNTVSLSDLGNTWQVNNTVFFFFSLHTVALKFTSRKAKSRRKLTASWLQSSMPSSYCGSLGPWRSLPPPCDLTKSHSLSNPHLVWTQGELYWAKGGFCLRVSCTYFHTCKHSQSLQKYFNSKTYILDD